MTLHSIAPQVLASGPDLLQIEAWARVAIGRVLNSLPEGVLIALFAWAMLRVLPKQNSRTRFAVWFLALLGVAIACFGGMMFTGFHSRVFDSSTLISSGISAISLPAHWAYYILIAWLLASISGIIRLAIGIFRLRKLRQSCVPVSPDDLDPSVCQTLAELNGSKSFAPRTVMLTTSERVRVPAALGLGKPIIALPEWTLAELPAADLNIIVRHEFAHLQRWDDWTNLLQKFARAVFFFHPAVWWIENRLSLEREMACDDVVVAQTDNPMGYASCLVSLLERSLVQRGWTMAQAIVHRAHEASDRLARILDKNRPAASGISKPALGLVGTFVVLCVAMLPQTPQFVAFEGAPMPAVESNEYSAALVHPATFNLDGQTSVRPDVIPADLKIGQTSREGFRAGPIETGRQGTAQTAIQSNAKFALARSKAASNVVNRGTVSRGTVNRGTVNREEIAAHSSPFPEALFEVSAVADLDFHPMIEPLVFVETAQFVPAPAMDSDSLAAGMIAQCPASAAMVWRVQVWQITLVSPMWQHLRVPVANKI